MLWVLADTKALGKTKVPRKASLSFTLVTFARAGRFLNLILHQEATVLAIVSLSGS